MNNKMDDVPLYFTNSLQQHYNNKITTTWSYSSRYTVSLHNVRLPVDNYYGSSSTKSTWTFSEVWIAKWYREL